MHSSNLMVLLVARVCGGVAMFVVVAHWLGVCGEIFGLNFICVCGWVAMFGFQETLRKSGKFFFFFFLTPHFKFFVLFF